MRVALAQMRVCAGHPDLNVTRMLQFIEEARGRGAELVAFPEMCLGGYFVGDCYEDPGFCRELMQLNEVVREASRGLGVIFGNVWWDDAAPCGRDGRPRRFNAAYVVYDRQYVRRPSVAFLPDGVQPKTLLPTYRYFDDQRHFLSLADLALEAGLELAACYEPFVVPVAGGTRVGVEVCEDLWCAEYRVHGRALNPTRYLIERGAAVVINISASPWTVGKTGARQRRIEFLREESGAALVPFFYVNCVGAQNTGKNIVVYDGASTVYDELARPVAMAPMPWEECLVEADSSQLTSSCAPPPAEVPATYQAEAIVRSVRHLGDVTGAAPCFVIGLSGGIDSALVAALLVQAVGPERVFGVTLPSVFNASLTQSIAARVAAALGIRFSRLPIDGLVALNRELVQAADLSGRGRSLTPLAEENIQAKLRATTLISTLAAKEGAFFTCNGNKLELALGYTTLYGDLGGAIAPIGDLTKAEVYELGRYLNRTVFRAPVLPDELFPNALFQFPRGHVVPSAELRPDQIDPMRFGYHCALLQRLMAYQRACPEDILGWYLEGRLAQELGISEALLQRWELQVPQTFVEDLEWFDRLFATSVFKRIQAPPIVVLSQTAFGMDFREAQLPYRVSPRYRSLRQQVLAMAGPYRERGHG